MQQKMVADAPISFVINWRTILSFCKHWALHCWASSHTQYIALKKWLYTPIDNWSPELQLFTWFHGISMMLAIQPTVAVSLVTASCGTVQSTSKI